MANDGRTTPQHDGGTLVAEWAGGREFNIRTYRSNKDGKRNESGKFWSATWAEPQAPTPDPKAADLHTSTGGFEARRDAVDAARQLIHDKYGGADEGAPPAAK